MIANILVVIIVSALSGGCLINGWKWYCNDIKKPPQHMEG